MSMKSYCAKRNRCFYVALYITSKILDKYKISLQCIVSYSRVAGV